MVSFIANSRFEPILKDGVEMAERFLDWNVQQVSRFIRCLASDLGRLGDAKMTKLSLGKVSKKSEMLVKAGIDSTRMSASPSLKTYRLLQLLNEAFSLGWTVKRGLIEGREDTATWINKSSGV
jgi:hypothetical protein